MSTLAKARDYLWQLCKGTVSTNIYVSDRPAAIPDSVTDFVIVSTPMRFRSATDRGDNAIMRGAVMVELYAKNLKNGNENTAKLNSMEQAFYSALGSANINGFRIKLRGASVAPPFENYHITVITLDLIIT